MTDGVGVLLRDLPALLEQSRHAVTLLPLGRNTEQLKGLLQTAHLAYGLLPMLLEDVPEIGMMRRL